MLSLLILTVGTGTKGDYSNLAQGLVNTLHQLRPRRFWLVPSASPDSTTLAEIVRDGAPDGCAFQPWSPSQPFLQIEQHDDLFVCRTALREVIQTARQQLRQGERLIVNPTSGTKQMSVAATLAALDEEIGEIVFTVGERADGVVKTGTERMAPFSTRQFFLERDLRLAGELFAAGAFFAAARVLKPYSEPEALQSRAKALCLHEWQRMNYAKAASHAAKFSEELRTHLKHLADADEFSVTVLGDLLAGADELLRWGDHEEALARYYRATEYAAKLRLEEAGEPTTELGWKDAWSRLQQLRDPLANEFWADGGLRRQLQERNESVYGHGQLPVDASVIHAVRDRLRNLFARELPNLLSHWSVDCRPKSLH